MKQTFESREKVHLCTFSVSDLLCTAVSCVGHHTTILNNNNNNNDDDDELDDTKKCLSSDCCVNPSKREEEEEEEEERDKMTTVGGGQQFVRVDFTNIRPKEKKESFVDERFHGCLSSTTTTPR